MAQHKELAVKIRKMNKGLISSSVFWLHFILSLCQSCGNQSASMTRRTAPPFVRRRMLEMVELARVQLLRRDPPACRQSGLCAVHLTPICTKLEKTWIFCGTSWVSLFSCTFKMTLLVTLWLQGGAGPVLLWQWRLQGLCQDGTVSLTYQCEIFIHSFPPREDPFFTHCLKFKDLKQS